MEVTTQDIVKIFTVAFIGLVLLFGTVWGFTVTVVGLHEIFS